MEKIIKQDKGLRARLMARLRAGVRDERGATAVFFAVGLLLLAPATLGLVDIYLTSTQRGQLQDAVDAAALYAARSEETTSEGIDRVGDAALRANLKLPQGQQITYSDFKLDGVKIIGTVKITPPSIGPALWTKADLQADSVVVRNSNNVEVAIVLDTTGSMKNEMTNLRTAADGLVDLVVKDVQTPYYSKAALIPYSVGVNAGDYAAAARGSITPGAAITSATKANPVLVTTSSAHGFTNNQRIHIEGTRQQISGKDFIVYDVTPTTFTLHTKTDGKGKVDGSDYSSFSAGTAYCVTAGCEYYRFDNADGGTSTFPVTTCATERTGNHAYDDTKPGTALVGRHYSSGAGDTGCQSSPIVPLTATKSTLKGQITNLKSNGSTAGHIGLAWGWYMVSPEWGGLWPATENKPAAYDTPQTIKVVVLMTDGAFNTNYCNGVSSKNSFGNKDQRANCDATNGNAFDQAEKLCENMKKKNIVIYTVGFNVSNDDDVTELLENCATDINHRYLPSSGVALKDAFKAIGQDINSLRIAK